ncbi:hypothetical protein [Actinocatenispora comari]|uniref:hypothetical protein n=1 Tax=Actinocatenispora comari TaxID=2807577 RepID=UPI003519DD12
MNATNAATRLDDGATVTDALPGATCCGSGIRCAPPRRTPPLARTGAAPAGSCGPSCCPRRYRTCRMPAPGRCRTRWCGEVPERPGRTRRSGAPAKPGR